MDGTATSKLVVMSTTGVVVVVSGTVDGTMASEVPVVSTGGILLVLSGIVNGTEVLEVVVVSTGMVVVVSGTLDVTVVCVAVDNRVASEVVISVDSTVA